jgi:hypothetical protein
MERKEGGLIGIGYLYRPESNYRYLEDAFGSLSEVRYLGTHYKERPGYSPDENILNIVQDNGHGYTGIILSESCLFAGLLDLACPTAIWISDYWKGNYHRWRYARLFDHVFVSQKDGLNDFAMAGCEEVHWLPVACDPQVHRDYGIERIYDVGFVGHVNLPSQQRRLKLLIELSKSYRMNDFQTPTYLQDMARVYSQSKIVVNIPNSGDLNMRVFESMSCGAMLLTEDIGNGQRELFEPGVHLDVYRSKEELLEKIDHYLAHDEERKRIATAGQREVLSKHRYTDRAETILAVFERSRGSRYRSTDPDEILRSYALCRSQYNRLDFLLNALTRSRCSLSTRSYIGARFFKSIFNVIRS